MRPCVTAHRRRQGSAGQVRECTGPAMQQRTYTQRAHNTHSPARLPVPSGRHPGHCLLVTAPSAQNITTQHNASQHSTTQHNTTQHNTTQHNTAQHNTTQHNTTQHNTTQHNTTQHNTTQHVVYHDPKSRQVRGRDGGQRAHNTHSPPVYLYPWVDIPAFAFW